MSSKRFGVIGAMDVEVLQLALSMEKMTTETVSDLTFYHGKIGPNEIILVKSGIGKVNAARCTQLLIDRWNPDYIVNTGIAGGVGAGLAVGDVVIGEETVQHDFDVTAFGYARGYLFLGEKDQPTVFRADETLCAAVSDTLATMLPPERIHRGRIATGDLFVSGAQAKSGIAREFSALAVEMEGCAVAQTASANGIPFVIVRAISDLADGTAAESYEEFETEAAGLSARAIEACIAAFH